MACFGGGLVGFAVASAIRVQGRTRLVAVAGASIGLSATIPLMLVFPSRGAEIGLFIAAGVMPLGMAVSGVVFDLTGRNFWAVIGAPGILMLLVSALALLSRDYRGFLAGTGEPLVGVARGENPPAGTG